MRKTIISLALAAALCAPATATFASPTTELTPDQELSKLIELNPGVTEAEMKAEIRAMALADNTDFNEILHSSYLEAKASSDAVTEDATGVSPQGV
jgi:hypothetical protein